MTDNFRHLAMDIISGGHRMRSSPPRAPKRVVQIGRSRATRRLRSDAYFFYTAGLGLVAVIAVAASLDWRHLAITVSAAVAAVVLQAGAGTLPTRRRMRSPVIWSLVRLTFPLALVAMVDFFGSADKPYMALYLPVVAAAGAIGVIQGSVVSALIALILLLPELQSMGAGSELATRGVGLAGAGILLAVATRRIISALEVALEQLGRTARAERRRARQIAGMEAIGRVLVGGGDRVQVLDRLLGLLVARFGYERVAVHLLDAGGQLHLGAQRGHASPLRTVSPEAGGGGRALRTRSTIFVADVSREPDGDNHEGVVSAVYSPLTVNDELLGLLTVESERPLEVTDRDIVAVLASRIATVVALHREREALAAREQLFRSLHHFNRGISANLALHELASEIAASVTEVVPADLVAVTVLDSATGGRYVVRALNGAGGLGVGHEIRPGEGVAGRAIRDRALVVDDAFGKDAWPASVRDLPLPEITRGAAAPMIRDDVVVGAITVARTGQRPAFSSLELEGLDLLAGLAALALANAFLHAEVAQLAIRDGLTGLYNRRYFDEALKHLLTAWARDRIGRPRPLSAIVFDLDHFGQLNKRHGHQVGDEVLRAFAGLLKDRFRGSDLVARLGGEEFVVVLDGATRDQAVSAAEAVRRRTEVLPMVDAEGGQISITVSAGCAQLDPQSPSREELLRTADVALFMAKRAGRNAVTAA